MEQFSLTDVEAGLAEVRRSPADAGTVHLIVRRPAIDQREVLEEGSLDLDHGLVGDTWKVRGSSSTEDGGRNPSAQVTVMNWRVIALLASEPERCALAGDQLYVDLDLSKANLPAGSRLALGSTVLEVTDKPHPGCAKFGQRFGADALRFVNSDVGNELRLRGINTKVVQAGTVRRGDTIRKLGTGSSGA